MLYILSLDILYSWRRGTGPRNPALDDFRALDSGVQFAQQGGAVEHHHPALHSHYLHPLSCQGFTDFPFPVPDIELPARKWDRRDVPHFSDGAALWS